MKEPLKVGQRVRLKGYSSLGRMVENMRGEFTQVLTPGSSIVVLVDKAGEVVVTPSQCVRLRKRRSVVITCREGWGYKYNTANAVLQLGETVEFREVKRK